MAWELVTRLSSTSHSTEPAPNRLQAVSLGCALEGKAYLRVHSIASHCFSGVIVMPGFMWGGCPPSSIEGKARDEETSGACPMVTAF